MVTRPNFPEITWLDQAEQKMIVVELRMGCQRMLSFIYTFKLKKKKLFKCLKTESLTPLSSLL